MRLPELRDQTGDGCVCCMRLKTLGNQRWRRRLPREESCLGWTCLKASRRDRNRRRRCDQGPGGRARGEAQLELPPGRGQRRAAGARVAGDQHGIAQVGRDARGEHDQQEADRPGEPGLLQASGCGPLTLCRAKPVFTVKLARGTEEPGFYSFGTSVAGAMFSAST